MTYGGSEHLFVKQVRCGQRESRLDKKWRIMCPVEKQTSVFFLAKTFEICRGLAHKNT